MVSSPGASALLRKKMSLLPLEPVPEDQQSQGSVGHLQELAASLEKARLAALRSDRKTLVLETFRQRELCASLSTLSADDYPPDARGILLEELARVARANRNYGAVLVRVRRTVDIFCRLLLNNQSTYLEPRRATFPKGLA